MTRAVLVGVIFLFSACKSDSVRSFKRYEIALDYGTVSVHILVTDGQTEGDLYGYASIGIFSDSRLGNVMIEFLDIEHSNENGFFSAKEQLLTGKETVDSGKTQYFYSLHFDKKKLPFVTFKVNGKIHFQKGEENISIELKGDIQTKVTKRNSYLSKY